MLCFGVVFFFLLLLLKHAISIGNKGLKFVLSTHTYFSTYMYFLQFIVTFYFKTCSVIFTRKVDHQNHRKKISWMGSQQVAFPNPQVKPGLTSELGQLCKVSPNWAWKIFLGRGFRVSLGNPFLCLTYVTVKNYVLVEYLWFIFCKIYLLFTVEVSESLYQHYLLYIQELVTLKSWE